MILDVYTKVLTLVGCRILETVKNKPNCFKFSINDHYSPQQSPAFPFFSLKHFSYTWDT